MRKLHAAILCTLLATVPLAGLAEAGTTTADVTLRVAPEGFVVPSNPITQHEATWLIDPAEDTRFNDRDGVAGCDLTVQDANDDGAIDGGEVLDAADQDGCIVGWDYTVFDCCGRFVTSVDGLDEVQWPVGWWTIQIDGVWADDGIDTMDLSDGQSLEFVYYAGAGLDPTDL